MSYYAGTSQTEEITVSQPPNIQLSVSPGSPWKLNQTITLTVTVPESPPASTAQFYMVLQLANTTVHLGSANLQEVSVPYSSGEAYTYGVPRAIYRATLQVTLTSPVSQTSSSGVTENIAVYGPVTFYAMVGGVKSNQVSGAILIPTKFTGVSVSPSTIYPGQTVTVTGQLQMVNVTDSSQWIPLGDQTISYTLTNSSGSTITSGSVTTNSSGNFTITFTAPSTPGSYTLDLVFAGSSSAYLAPAGLHIGFGSTTSSTTKLSTTDLAILGGGIAVIGGLAAYEALKRKK